MRKKIGIFLLVIMLVTSAFVIFSNNNVKATNAYVVLYPTDDSTINAGNPDNHYGSFTDTTVRNAYGAGGSDNWEMDSLIKFDISSLPSDTIIRFATLKLYYYSWDDNNPAGHQLKLYRAISNWNEGTVTWNNQPSWASQYTNYSTVPSSASIWMEWNVTSDVQKFINGNYNNYGWKITDEYYWGNSNIPRCLFYSKEYGSYIPYLEIELVSPDFVYVDDDFDENTTGWGYDHFNNIQDGIDAVNESGTVYVFNGTYYENVVVNKTIDLIGEDKNTTIVDGGESGDVVYVSADTVNITGFTIKNSGHGYYPNPPYFDSGIHIDSDNCTVFRNVITDNNGYGISLNHSSYTKIIGGNIIINNQIGEINLSYSNNNTIKNNIIKNSDLGGRWGLFNSYDNLINHNTVINSSLELCLSSGNNISDNTFTHSNIGLFYNSNYNIIYYNEINASLWDGIYLCSSSNNTIVNNNIKNCIDDGISSTYYCIPYVNSNNNTIYHNNFINNTSNAYDMGCNNWDNGYPSGGNYWDDYTGNDSYQGPNQDISGIDGIGDTPYNISGGANQDLYPLMHPFEMYYILDVIPENTTINEGTVFNVTVKSLGGTYIPEAIVEFNDELILTDYNGTVWFTAPQVSIDTYYDIKATKTGYTGANETILIKNVLSEFKNAFIFGRIANLTTVDDTIMFEAVNIKVITFKPFSFNPYKSGEKFIISKDYKGLVGYRFILAFCKVLS